MKKQIFTIGLIIVFVLSARFAQTQTIQSTPQKQGQGQDVVNQEADQTVIHVKESSPAQAFYVNVSLNHENLIYEEGDEITVTVESNKSGYLHLFYKDPAGKVSVLFPNKFQQDNRIEACKRLLIPNYGKEAKITTTAPFGKDVFQAVVTTNPIDLQPIINFQDNKSIHQLSRTDLDAVEKKFNQERDPENNIAEYATTITSVPKGQIPQMKKKRIFVGVCTAKFSNSHIAVFPHRNNDIAELARFFFNNGSVDPEESLIFINENVTKDNIHKLFYKYLPNHTKPGDEIIFYWTGEFSLFKDSDSDNRVDPDDINKKSNEALLLYNSDLTDPNTMLTDNEFGRWAMNLKGRKVLFIFEGSCHFGISKLASLKELGVSNFSIIDSGRKPFSTSVQEEKQMSVMTWSIIDCLKNNRRITHMDLFHKVKPQVYDYVKNTFNSYQDVSVFDDLDSPLILNP